MLNIVHFALGRFSASIASEIPSHSTVLPDGKVVRWKMKHERLAALLISVNSQLNGKRSLGGEQNTESMNFRVLRAAFRDEFMFLKRQILPIQKKKKKYFVWTRILQHETRLLVSVVELLLWCEHPYGEAVYLQRFMHSGVCSGGCKWRGASGKSFMMELCFFHEVSSTPK